MMIVKALLSAAVAAGFAMVFNTVLKRAGQFGVAFLAPFFEEWLKTGSAMIFNVPLPVTHILFGVYEAAGDCVWGGRFRLLAALFGVMAHTAFGLITYFALGAGYHIVIAVIAASAVHVSWNILVLRLSAVKRTHFRSP